MKNWKSLAAALLLLSMPAVVQAEPAAVEAAVANADRSEPDTAMDESRQPAAVLQFLGLEEGDRVLDVMAGGGYYTELMARAVGPEGHVVGQNPPGVVEAYSLGPVFERRGYGAERLPNAERLDVEFADAAFEPNSFDFALFHMVLHDLWHENPPALPRTEPADFLAALYTGMKPGGIVGVVDHVGTDAADPRGEVGRLHRIDPQVVRAAMEEAGFVHEEESDLLRNPEDTHEVNVFDPAIRGRTDRFVYRFRKPPEE
ncbi:MAG: class I SAM-dependent methyltransferase [Parasphingopyxis sp.]|nr:methyltransferase domain-containing protein [Sphingomonadales bacterium]